MDYIVNNLVNVAQVNYVQGNKILYFPRRMHSHSCILNRGSLQTTNHILLDVMRKYWFEYKDPKTQKEIQMWLHSPWKIEYFIPLNIVDLRNIHQVIHDIIHYLVLHITPNPGRISQNWLHKWKALKRLINFAYIIIIIYFCATVPEICNYSQKIWWSPTFPYLFKICVNWQALCK